MLGYELFAALFPPHDINLPIDRHLLIIPSGILYYLPFETLITEKSTMHQDDIPFLINKCEISYAPSASVSSFIKSAIKKKPHQFELLAFGDPLFEKPSGFRKKNDSNNPLEVTRMLYGDYDFHSLKYSGEEVQKIADLYPDHKRKIYLKEAAKEEELKKGGLEQFDKIHFSTHGIVDEQVPGRSGLVLTIDNDPAEDGILQMNEIFNLKFDADLIVLSACQTGLGKLVNGEGMIGLTRAFFYSGASALLVSLWAVDDRSTSELMVNFYKNLDAGLSKRTALRQAKLEQISKGTAVGHPYHWAPFILIGDYQ